MLPQRVTGSADSPSTISLKQASTIAEIRTKALNTFKAGGFGSIPGKANHYAMTKGATVVQIHGEGPFDLVYVNPDDNPQKKMAAKQ